MLGIVLGWVVISLIGIRKSGKSEHLFTLEQTTALKGICALEIMLGHIGLMTGSIFLYGNRKAGVLFVGVFFMLSGYGVAYGAKNKENYMTGFIGKKAVRLLMPSYAIYFIYALVLIVVEHSGQYGTLFDIGQYVKTLNWYVYEQLALYVLFGLSNKLMTRYRDFCVVFVLILFVIVAFIGKLDNPVYGSTLCFALGVFLYDYEGKVMKYRRKHLGFCVFTCISVCLISIGTYTILGDNSVIGNLVARNIAAMSFCLLIVTLLERINIGNKLLIQIGKCSYEIFIIHFFVMSILIRFSISSQLIFSLYVIAISVIAAMVIHYCGNGLQYLIRKGKK